LGDRTLLQQVAPSQACPATSGLLPGVSDEPRPLLVCV
jgi:hypothetical protein